jgi:catechol 2,3-dioxygenase-like lactoylglutathione lyase family enzyme
MDIHHVGQLLDADFDDAVAFYRGLGLDLRETTDGPVRVASFDTDPAEFRLVGREERGSAADPATAGQSGSSTAVTPCVRDRARPFGHPLSLAAAERRGLVPEGAADIDDSLVSTAAS